MATGSVSVIIPCYNVEKYLDEAVQSVLNQTYRNIEIILVDDGSTDDTSSICDRYADKYELIEVIHKTNGGLSDARNTGASRASGEFVYFLDADDYISSEMLGNLVEAMEREGADFTFFDSNTVDELGNGGVDPKIYIRSLPGPKVRPGCDWIRLLLEGGQYSACVPLHFYRRSFLVKNQLKFEKRLIHEDEHFSFWAYMKAQRVLRSDGAFYYRRLREGSILTGAKAKTMFCGAAFIFMNVSEAYFSRVFREEGDIVVNILQRMLDLMTNRFGDMDVPDRLEVLRTYREALRKYLRIVIAERKYRKIEMLMWRYYATYGLCRKSGRRKQED